ncbi:peptidoglycan DD-metalloendopeptidase family protein [Silanimonas sp.]|uniref:murein hydrolase activator EnvC family protein n=1 Tax=Silanimonas sp. TaxID=1929290 RepID=UPI0022C02119|nr:peptidoglycan DD-metalloendopeptidase family protein [Silanimonas sp.]MCZ8115220.1 peptidoglycan DD-metalloendopeptidase family protein [Silanimonas sp.]
MRPARAFAAGALALLLASSAFVATPSFAQPADPQRAAREAEAQAQLDALKRRVVSLAAEQKRAEAEKSETLSALREADARVAEAQQAVDVADAEQARLAEALAAKEAERTALAEALKAQREVLARLVRAAYAAGRHEQLKLLLAQDQVGAMGRALAYHRHVQADRARRVQGVLAELDALATLTAEVQRQQAEVAAAAASATAALAALETEREARRQTLVGLEAAFKGREARLAALGRDQRAVEALLAELRDAIADIPKRLDDDRPFPSRRGQLPLPVDGGRVLERFGAALPGGLQSDGVRFAVARGTPVRAVAPGRVAYADWLKGYGLLLILDHGEGWMSLYAHNDTLRRGVGDWVGQGETLARAGDSGGAPQTALYFELRRNGQPVDPRGWWR